MGDAPTPPTRPQGSGVDSYHLRDLVSRLERGVAANQAYRRHRRMLVVGLLLFWVVMCAWKPSWLFAMMALLAGAALIGGVRTLAPASPASVSAVLDAVRHAPERIVSVRRYWVKSIAYLAVVLEVRTEHHRVVARTADSAWLFEQLRQRCPRAVCVDRVAGR